MEEKNRVKKTILILEDNPLVIAQIVFLLQKIETEYPVEFIPTSFPTLKETQAFLQKNTQQFDIILLDRNDKIGESYHDLPLESLGLDSIISISSVQTRNEEAKKRGISKSILKDYEHLETFLGKLEIHLKRFL